jgi:uncharacterized protein YbcI
MVALHKEQFGRGPTKAQSHLAGAGALLCVMEDALLPAERTMVEMGEQQRVRVARMFLQVATADQIVAPAESITGRTVRAFASATDPDKGVVMENFIFGARRHTGPPDSPLKLIAAVTHVNRRVRDGAKRLLRRARNRALPAADRGAPASPMQSARAGGRRRCAATGPHRRHPRVVGSRPCQGAWKPDGLRRAPPDRRAPRSSATAPRPWAGAKFGLRGAGEAAAGRARAKRGSRSADALRSARRGPRV